MSIHNSIHMSTHISVHSCWVLESPLSVSLRGKLAVFRTDSGRGYL